MDQSPPVPASGYKSSEIIVAILGFGISILVAKGALTAAQAQELTHSIPTILGTIGVLYVALQPVLKYIDSRLKLKSKLADNFLEAEKHKASVLAMVDKVLVQNEIVKNANGADVQKFLSNEPHVG